MNNLSLYPYSLNGNRFEESSTRVKQDSLYSPSALAIRNKAEQSNTSSQNLIGIQTQRKENKSASPSVTMNSPNNYFNGSSSSASLPQQINRRFNGSGQDAINNIHSHMFSYQDIEDQSQHLPPPLMKLGNYNTSTSSSQRKDSVTNQNLQHNNISTIKMKTLTGSYMSTNGSGLNNMPSIAVSGLQGASEAEGVCEGQNARKQMFSFNNIDMEKMKDKQVAVEEEPPLPIEFSLSEKNRFSYSMNTHLIEPAKDLAGSGSANIHNSGQQNNNSLLVATPPFPVLPLNPNGTNYRKDSVKECTIKTGTLAYAQYIVQKRLWKNKWMIMSLYISKSIASFKRILILTKPNYLTRLQMDLINDKCAHYDKLREDTEKRYQGWLFNDDKKWLSRKQKKKVLIFLKSMKRITSITNSCFKEAKAALSNFDQKYPPISPLSTGIKVFDFLVFLLTVFNAIFIPLEICFNEDVQTSSMGTAGGIILRHISPYLYLLDIIKFLNTSCFVRGQIINDRISIFWSYVRQHFFCDIISLLALFLYQVNPIVTDNFTLILFYFRLFTGLHVMGKLREYWILYDYVNAGVNLILLVAFAYFFAHVFSCFWYFVGMQSMTESWITHAGIAGDSFASKYLESLQFILSSFSTLNTNVVAITSYEKLYLILMNCFTLFILGYSFHEASLIFENLSLKRRNYLSQLKEINRYMSDHNVSENYSSLARKYLQYVTNEGLDTRQVSAENSLSGLSLQLREEIIQNSYLNQLKQIPAFSQYFSEQFLEKLALKMREQILGPDEYVININKLQQPRIFIVQKGMIEFFVNIGTQRTDKKDSQKSFKIFKENEYFGSYEFFSHTYKPHLSARSIGVSVVQYVYLSDFLGLLEEFPEEREAFSYIKEMVSIYQKLDLVGVTCYSCGERDHQALQCPYLFYDQQKAAIRIKTDQDHHQFLRQFIRKEKKKYNCLNQCKKIYDTHDRFVIDNADWLLSQSSMRSLELEDNLQLNNIDLPKIDSQHLDSYFHIRQKTSSIGTLGTTLRVREEKAPGDLNGIYFDSELDAYSMNSAYLKNPKGGEYEWNNGFNLGSGLMINVNTPQLLHTNSQPGNPNSLIQKTPSLNSFLDEEDPTNFMSRKILSKLTSSPSIRTAIPAKLPDLKYRSKSTHIKPSIGDSLLEEAQSLIDLRSLSVKSPRPNTVVVPSQKQDSSQPSLIRRNTTKTRNRGQSFNLDTNQYRDNTSPWRESSHRSMRKQYEQSIFSQSKMDPKTVDDISEEESSFSEEEEIERNPTSQRSFSHKEHARSDKQSRRSEKQAQSQSNIAGDVLLENTVNFANNFSAVHSFSKFFPHNNIENVLEILNKQSRNIRRARSKKLTKKLSHRSIKKQSSLRSKKKMLFAEDF